MKLYFPCLLKLRTCYGSRLGNRRLTLDHESLITGGVVRMDGWMDDLPTHYLSSSSAGHNESSDDQSVE